MRTFLTALIAFVALPSVVLADPVGVWSRTNVDDEETKIEITMCTENVYCGSIVWMEFPRKDDRNVVPELRDRDLVGLQIFDDVVSTGPNTYAGTVYNPEIGFTLSGTVTQTDDDTLELEGCIGPQCSADTWTRSAL